MVSNIRAIEGRSRVEGWCDHRARPTKIVFTEMGCHDSCLRCGVLGPGCATSEEAQRVLLTAAKRKVGRCP